MPLTVALVLALVACQPADPPPPDAVDTLVARPSAVAPSDSGAAVADSLPPLTADGWGPLRVGMTRAGIVAAAGDDAHPELVGGPEPEECDEFRPMRAPEGMLVMVEDGRLTRISLLRDSPVATTHGLRVGAAAADVKAALGAGAVVTPHKYQSAPAEYVTTWVGDSVGPGARGFVYEIGDDGRVSHVHAGGPSIQYVEGCL